MARELFTTLFNAHNYGFMASTFISPSWLQQPKVASSIPAALCVRLQAQCLCSVAWMAKNLALGSMRIQDERSGPKLGPERPSHPFRKRASVQNRLKLIYFMSPMALFGHSRLARLLSSSRKVRTVQKSNFAIVKFGHGHGQNASPQVQWW